MKWKLKWIYLGAALCSVVGVPLNDFSSVTQFTIIVEAICCAMEFMCFFVKLKAWIFKFFTWKEALELVGAENKSLTLQMDSWQPTFKMGMSQSLPM